MTVTIFTPTYNRDYTLERLYNSLINQSSKDFEWVVVDDGSTDKTSLLLSQWITEGKIAIRYFYQNNSGKPAAHNKGVKESQGELFCCVDSDDYLSLNAIERIIDIWNCQKNNDLVGILAFKANLDGTPLTKINDKVDKSTLRDAYKKHGLKNDTMLIYKTSILKKYSFPIINGEKFIPEGYLYNKLDKEGPLLIIREPLYYCEYQNDGYSSNVAKLLYDNYKSYIYHISTRMHDVDNWLDTILDSIRINAIIVSHKDIDMLISADYKLLRLITLIPSFFLYFIRYYPLNEKDCD